MTRLPSGCRSFPNNSTICKSSQSLLEAGPDELLHLAPRGAHRGVQLAWEGGAGLEPQHGQALPQTLGAAPEISPGPGLVTGQAAPTQDQEHRVQLVQDHAAPAREPRLDEVEVGQHLLAQCSLSAITICIIRESHGEVTLPTSVDVSH